MFEKEKETQPSEKAPIAFKFTDDEMVAIGNIRNSMALWANRDGGEEKAFYLREDMEAPMHTLGLVEYVISLTCIYHNDSNKEAAAKALDKAIQTQAKICCMHDFPFYLCFLATLYDMKGDKDAARMWYVKFLDAQSAFKPNKMDDIATNFLKNLGFELTGAIYDAKAFLGQDS